jgi:hypothetical protein
MRRARAVALLLVFACLAGAAGGFAAATWVYHHPGSDYFPDVSPTSNHNDDIGFIAEMGVTHGYWDGTYRPSNLVDRQEMATYIARSVWAGNLYAVLVVDYAYFSGYYFGETAYLQGRITWDQYQSYLATFNWLLEFGTYENGAMQGLAMPAEILHFRTK